MAENQWFILIGQERQGPMSAHDVRYLLTRRSIDGGTLVWREGMDSWVRLRDIEEFHPRKKEVDEPEQSEPEAESKPDPGPTSKRALTLQRLLPAVLTLALVGGAAFVFLTGVDEKDPIQQKQTQQRRQPRRQTPQDLINALKRGERDAKTQLIRAGSRSVPALIEALIEKGSPLSPRKVKAILIEIGPSSSSAFGDALEGLDLSKAAQIILVEVLGEFGGLTSVPALIIALGNPNPEVQERAIEAISQLNPDFGPALARRYTSPVDELSKRQKMNLAKALGEHRSPKSIPAMQKAQRSERDAEVIEALAKAVEQISRNPRTSDPVPPVVVAAQTPTSSSSDSPSKPVSIHVSAIATATATAESDDEDDKPEQPAQQPPDQPSADPEPNPDQARKLAEEGQALRDQGKDAEALEKYRQAYALNPIRAYLIIIINLEGNLATATADADTTSPPPLPEIEAPQEVDLAEIYSEIAQPDPDLGPFSGSLGRWDGRIDSEEPFNRDGRRDLYIVKGASGQDFVAAVRHSELTPDDVGSQRQWKGVFQGFRVVDDSGQSRMLPVLSIE
ncbi:TPA: hypothetical protein DCE37_07070 [Candidatus Latescibacteria bacterium]|nr:hypothetical protein [Candidatus Latescibacterota bacterium]